VKETIAMVRGPGYLLPATAGDAASKPAESASVAPTRELCCGKGDPKATTTAVPKGKN